ncbi:hypothetical protein [Bacillus thuringiensis]|uniref:hypothetical protein n=1 Tax=Bacillus thuringiensis TaxID=1428 RepID=UPI003B986B6B
MKKIWLWMISSILFFSIGIPVHVIAEEKAFDPTDFSTYGLGMKESIGQESAAPLSATYDICTETRVAAPQSIQTKTTKIFA